MLGLKRDTVQVVPYNPAWPEAFQREKSELQRVLGTRCLDIQHIGSTAVPGLAAKPVLDIGVAVAHIFVIYTCVCAMKDLGYVYYGDQKKRGDHFFAKGSDERQTCFIHMVQEGHPVWQDFLRFRDYLIEHPGQLHRYMRIKTQMAAHYAQDRRGYTEAKAGFIQEILRLAPTYNENDFSTSSP